MKKHTVTAALCALLASTSALAGGGESKETGIAMDSAGHVHTVRPDDHAPIGVMGDHTHKQGEWMLSYRYSRMEMDGNRDGTHDVSIAEVLTDFMVAPKKMRMEMHMFGLMVGVNDNLTMMAMLPYVSKSMDHVTRMGAEFTTKTDGAGDAKLAGLYTIYRQGNARVHVNAGLSLPTGSIDKRDDIPAGNVRLPYAMQLGSGTYDLLPGITYANNKGDWSWGSQINAVIRLGENDNDYTLGNEYGATAWGARRLNEYASVSLRLDGKVWGDIDGADPMLVPGMVPTARPDLRGGRRVDALLGLNIYLPELKGQRIAIEGGVPVYQNLDGPQLETDYRMMIGWQWSF